MAKLQVRRWAQHFSLLNGKLRPTAQVHPRHAHSPHLRTKTRVFLEAAPSECADRAILVGVSEQRQRQRPYQTSAYHRWKVDGRNKQNALPRGLRDSQTRRHVV